MTQTAETAPSGMPRPATRPADDSPVKPRPFLAAWSLAWREIIRFVRQRNRVIGAIVQPALFWVLFGAGFDRSFAASAQGGASGQSFQAYYFPGSLMLILLFTAIFATISIIEDRREGFLQAVLTAPLPRWSMVLGKVAGGSLLAVFQGLIFLLLALTLDIEWSLTRVLLLTLLMLVSAVALTSLGFVIAWRMESTQGFHAIMSVLLMPMWLLSGAFFPIPPAGDGASLVQQGMHWLMRCNPLTYCVAAARRLLFDGAALDAWQTPDQWVCWTVACLFAVTMFAAACWISAQRTSGDLL
ncbi:ABC transporter permease [Lignipirellula cremea]|uniref:Transport permease protein n=1 Tax=Lignipirellula cremea TaxID=2528010 RepID=A0A518DYU3_9BACT|nr:ABC transporter permease [Lignipirellula cremea]QDU97017.1 Inner membrane transport permease YbhR [Lignipirellula cremea]